MANTYFVKKDWIFNLESCSDKLHCIEYDLEDGILNFPINIAGTDINDYDDLDALREEIFQLEWIAKSRKVTGKEYGRIKDIVSWRVMQRYLTCINSGMEESKAGMCFQDM